MELLILNKSQQENGFTLIEVLIAVAILAIALIAVIRVTGVAIKNSEYLKQKTIAHWVAMDVMAKAQVGLIATPSAGGNQSGQQSMLGISYPWQMTATNLTSQAIVQVQLRVFSAGKKQSLDAVFGYFPQPENRI